MTSGHLREVKIKRNLQTVISKRGRGRLREVVAYKRFQRFLFELDYFGILKTWSLNRGGRLREVVARRGSIVCLSHCCQQCDVMEHPPSPPVGTPLNEDIYTTPLKP